MHGRRAPPPRAAAGAAAWACCCGQSVVPPGAVRHRVPSPGNCWRATSPLRCTTCNQRTTGSSSGSGRAAVMGKRQRDDDDEGPSTSGVDATIGAGQRVAPAREACRSRHRICLLAAGAKQHAAPSARCSSRLPSPAVHLCPGQRTSFIKNKVVRSEKYNKLRHEAKRAKKKARQARGQRERAGGDVGVLPSTCCVASACCVACASELCPEDRAHRTLHPLAATQARQKEAARAEELGLEPPPKAIPKASPYPLAAACCCSPALLPRRAQRWGGAVGCFACFTFTAGSITCCLLLVLSRLDSCRLPSVHWAADDREPAGEG